MEAGWKRARTIATTAAVYAAWIVTSVLGVGAMIVCHTALLRLYVALGFDKYGLANFNNLAVITLVGLWLVGVVASEGWYRRAPDAGDLARRFGRAAMALVMIAFLAFVLGRL